ncbi:porin [Lacibacter sp. H375]|uniref:porin n=1 Tax=Lacibacter sp. H375 TaxID=3133424 RepID=UPI0030BC18ED
MLRKISALAIVCSSLFLTAKAQDSTSGSLKISGYVDAYYRYNFNNAKDVADPLNHNSRTSFTNSSNSFELGMASLKAEYTKGKIGVVADLGFGTRAAEFSYVETANGQYLGSAIKQAYVTYAPSDKVKFTIGKWATHMGYELVDPQLNRNYSMSHLFTYGPFTHTGLKADFTLGSGFGLMVGVANPTDYVSAPFAKKNVIAQVSKTSDHLNAYLNYVGGKDLDDNSVNQIGLTLLAPVTSKFGLGLDAAYKTVDPSAAGSNISWWGTALYVNIDPSDKFGITLRGEHFADDDGLAGFGTGVTAGTLSFNIKPVPGIMIVPEFRLDGAGAATYYKNSDAPGAASQKSTGSFILAAVLSF